MVAPTHTFLGFNYSMQIALFEPRNYTTIKKDTVFKRCLFYGADDEARPSKAKAFVGTHAGTETIHRIVSICRQIALFEPLNDTI